jgi:CBS domain-containing protein/gamma-glutamyl:cysteine ligase YbdK (ATP-grasp superfamily)
VGSHEIERELDADRLRRFTKKLLTDLRAIESMLDAGAIESGVRRIGAEQELFLVSSRWGAAYNNLEILQDLADDDHFTTELGRFNLEFNLDPMMWGGDCLSQMESQLDTLLGRVRQAAEAHGAEVVMTGILPTLEKSDLTLAQMTPKPRYFALNEAMTRLRGGAYIFHLKGQDELKLTHDSVMLEAANTSFQVHFQTGPEEFARLYNIAQAVAAPVLAAATNSPLLFGKRLWRETRIALFQQSVDTRAPTSHIREQSPRVRFGKGWIDDSVIEIFQEDVSRFRVLLAADVDEDPFTVLRAGGVPSLQALRLFNGTIYRWNRPCYGISEGKPHLRIENRVLPAGPSLVDEVANAALWLGLMSGVVEQHRDIRQVLTFDQVKENFVAAARLGLGAHLWWVGQKDVPARELLLEELIPLARHGLELGHLRSEDIDRYLGVLTERVQSGRTGSQWLLDSYGATRQQGTRAERLAAIVAATVRRQKEAAPVHTWPLAGIDEAGGWQAHYLQLGQFMTTDLFTVNEDELVDLAASMMEWRKIRHVPVEDAQHRLVGLVTHRTILRLLARDPDTLHGSSVPVSQIMERNLVTAAPTMSTLEAINLMRLHKVGCLPVVEGDRLVGIVTERDFMNVAGQLLEAVLHGRAPVERVQRGDFAADTTDD